MYLNYWHLENMPFENKPTPRFFYCSSQHEEALARLEYVVTQKKQLALITGEYGSGKTMLAHMLREKLSAGQYHFIYAGNPFFNANDLLHYLLQLLIVPGGSIEKVPENKIDALHLFTEILRRNRQINKHTVIIFDETHLISDIRVFEEIRVLLNFTFDNNYDLTLILLGQSEVREKIAQLPQFKQRINFQYHLQALSEGEVGAYLQHRLKVSGHKDGDVFLPEAVHEIFINSHGLSRTINNIADVCLMVGLDKHSSHITAEIARAALDEVLL
ncbi:MAG: AAA family ATPase [Endomicrobiales bacterium]|jgi:type II secretory pathway predicted ATPase ExeA